MSSPLILLCAGGTGGHLFPAQALANALLARGFRVQLATDERAAHYGGDFPAEHTHIIPSATFGSKAPFAVLASAKKLYHGYALSKKILREIAPRVVVGFGGYPTLPPLFAACALKIPTLIHEQNAVMGRANRLLAPRVTRIATGFPGVFDKNTKLKDKASFVGTPLRPKVLEAAKTPFAPPNETFNLVIFGGSQGARVMREVVPETLASLPAAFKAKLRVIQQARDEDEIFVREAYKQAGIAAEVSPFFQDLPAILAQSHLVIARSGASTVAELAAIGRASILVPLPHALDNDQLNNALVLASSFGAIVMVQKDFTPPLLAAQLLKFYDNPESLGVIAENARQQGRLDAAQKLAELVASMA